jgi:hypothetical protein
MLRSASTPMVAVQPPAAPMPGRASATRGSGRDRQRHLQQSPAVINNLAYEAGGCRVEKHPRLLGDAKGDGRQDIVAFGDHTIAADVKRAMSRRTTGGAAAAQTPTARGPMVLSARDPPLHAAGYALALALRTGRAQARSRTRCIQEMSVLILSISATSSRTEPCGPAPCASRVMPWPCCASPSLRSVRSCSNARPMP